jgi:hypothetical protein
MIPDDQVEEVRAKADLVDVIGELVPLKKAGKEFKACCPFHEERTPSFYVVPSKGFYKCFGCGEYGVGGAIAGAARPFDRDAELRGTGEEASQKTRTGRRRKGFSKTKIPWERAAWMDQAEGVVCELSTDSLKYRSSQLIRARPFTTLANRSDVQSMKQSG